MSGIRKGADNYPFKVTNGIPKIEDIEGMFENIVDPVSVLEIGIQKANLNGIARANGAEDAA